MTFKKISLLLNFYHHISAILPPHLSVFKGLRLCAKQLSLWLVMDEHEQNMKLLEAQAAYTEAIKHLNDYDSRIYNPSSSFFVIAADYGYSDLVSDMINAGANISFHGPLALRSAAESGNENIVEILCKKNLPIHISNPVYFKYLHIVRFYVRQGLLLPKDYLTVLFHAIYDGNTLVVEFLLSQKVDLNQYDSSGESPLTLAARLGYAGILSDLIKWGAQLDLANKKGVTALVSACMHNHIGVIHLLLLHCSKYSAQSQDISSALSEACVRGYIHVATVLIAAGADPNTDNADGQSLLYNVVTRRSPGVLKLLLGKGADPNKANPAGFTPLMEAAWIGDLEIVQALLEGGAKVNAMNKYESTAIFWAVEKGSYDVVKTLIEWGANLFLVNITNSETPDVGESPRSLALLNGHGRIAQLIERGMVRQAFWELKDICSLSEVRHKIAIHEVHGISKGQVVDYLINIGCHPPEKLALLKEAIALDADSQPSNALSLYMHIPQGIGFKRFFSSEPTNAVSRIKHEIAHLERLLSRQTAAPAI